jgi:hypothetical protein
MRRLLGVAFAATMLSLPAVAEDGSLGKALVGEEIDVSYEASRARLVAEGYQQVSQVNGSALHLKALDPQGSAVVLTLSPHTGEIDQTVSVDE